MKNRLVYWILSPLAGFLGRSLPLIKRNSSCGCCLLQACYSLSNAGESGSSPTHIATWWRNKGLSEHRRKVIFTYCDIMLKYWAYLELKNMLRLWCGVKYDTLFWENLEYTVTHIKLITTYWRTQFFDARQYSAKRNITSILSPQSSRTMCTLLYKVFMLQILWWGSGASPTDADCIFVK